MARRLNGGDPEQELEARKAAARRRTAEAAGGTFDPRPDEGRDVEAAVRRALQEGQKEDNPVAGQLQEAGVPYETLMAAALAIGEGKSDSPADKLVEPVARALAGATAKAGEARAEGAAPERPSDEWWSAWFDRAGGDAPQRQAQDGAARPPSPGQPQWAAEVQEWESPDDKADLPTARRVPTTPAAPDYPGDIPRGRKAMEREYAGGAAGAAEGFDASAGGRDVGKGAWGKANARWMAGLGIDEKSMQKLSVNTADIMGAGHLGGPAVAQMVGRMMGTAQNAFGAMSGDPLSMGKLGINMAEGVVGVIQAFEGLGAKAKEKIGAVVDNFVDLFGAKKFGEIGTAMMDTAAAVGDAANFFTLNSFGIIQDMLPFGKMVSFFGETIGKAAYWALEAFEGVREWSTGLHQANMQFGEFSTGMARVQAAQEVRDIQLSAERGDRRAVTADDLAESRHRLNAKTAVWEDMWGNLMNVLGAETNKLLEKLVPEGDENRNKAGDMPDGVASQMIDEAGARGWIENYGRPDVARNRQGPRGVG